MNKMFQPSVNCKLVVEVWEGLQVLISRACTGTDTSTGRRLLAKSLHLSQRTDGGIRSFVWNSLRIFLNICLSLFLSPDLWSMWRDGKDLSFTGGRLPGIPDWCHRVEITWLWMEKARASFHKWTWVYERMAMCFTTLLLFQSGVSMAPDAHLRAPTGNKTDRYCQARWEVLSSCKSQVVCCSLHWVHRYE